MSKKVSLVFELDTDALNELQAKADKLVATLKEAEALMERLKQKEPPYVDDDSPCFDEAFRLARDLFKPPD